MGRKWGMVANSKQSLKRDDHPPVGVVDRGDKDKKKERVTRIKGSIKSVLRENVKRLTRGV